MGEGLVQVTISRRGYINPIVLPLPTWTPHPNRVLDYLSGVWVHRREGLIFRACGVLGRWGPGLPAPQLSLATFPLGWAPISSSVLTPPLL
jgi:hypothetical protein